MSLSEQIHALQAQLLEAKNLHVRGDWKSRPPSVVELKPSECDALGGDVDYDEVPGCSLNLTCTTTTVGPSGKIELFIVCIDEADSGP